MGVDSVRDNIVFFHLKEISSFSALPVSNNNYFTGEFFSFPNFKAISMIQTAVETVNINPPTHN